MSQTKAVPPKKRKGKSKWQKYDAKLQPKTRLPDKSMYFTLFNQSLDGWNGTLIIEASDELVTEIVTLILKHKGKRFDGAAGGVFGLLNFLDNCYRRTLPPAPK